MSYKALGPSLKYIKTDVFKTELTKTQFKTIKNTTFNGENENDPFYSHLQSGILLTGIQDKVVVISILNNNGKYILPDRVPLAQLHENFPFNGVIPP